MKRPMPRQSCQQTTYNLLYYRSPQIDSHDPQKITNLKDREVKNTRLLLISHLSCRPARGKRRPKATSSSSTTTMSDNSSGFPSFHSHSYGSDYARPLFRVASFSDEQELHVSSPRSRSNSLSRTPSKTSVSGKLSMKKMQQALDEKSMEDEGT
jgi:hypothetical protein